MITLPSQRPRDQGVIYTLTYSFTLLSIASRSHLSSIFWKCSLHLILFYHLALCLRHLSRRLVEWPPHWSPCLQQPPSKDILHTTMRVIFRKCKSDDHFTPFLQPFSDFPLLRVKPKLVRISVIRLCVDISMWPKMRVIEWTQDGVRSNFDCIMAALCSAFFSSPSFFFLGCLGSLTFSATKCTVLEFSLKTYKSWVCSEGTDRFCLWIWFLILKHH